MITGQQYLRIVSEYYDLSDYYTKKNVLFCNEAQKATNVEHIVQQLYTHIKSNCTAIDFGSIPKSKGIITKVDNFQEIVDCLNTIHDLILEYNEDTKLVDVLTTAINNIQTREKVFSKAFALNIEMPIMMYNTTVLSIVAGTSLLISTSVDYVKNGHDSFSIAFDKSAYVKSQDHLLYQYAEQFNKECFNGNVDRLFNACIKTNMTNVRESVDNISYDSINEGIIASAVAISGLVISTIAAIPILIKALRMIIYYFLRMRMSYSDWFEEQAYYLQINAENLKYRDTISEDDKKKIYQKQMKMVEKLRSISNKLALKDVKASREAERDDYDYDTKHRYEDDSSDDNNSSDDGGLF